MRIVVLDGYALNPSDQSWDDFKDLGELMVYDRTPSEQILERASTAEAILTNKTPVRSEVIAKLPRLKYIGVLATGYNIIDVAAASERNIIVSNIPDYGSYSVAQLTFALLLELCHHVQRHSDSVHEGKWSASKDWSYWDYPLVELAGKTIGIIGFGSIGQKVGDIASSFGMNVVGVARTPSDQSHRKNFRWVAMDELLRESDVVSIHAPLTDETKDLINAAALSTMKRNAFLLNTSRGPIIVESDLADALNNSIIAGAGIDVLSIEPPPKDNPLFNARNCIITPHIAWATTEARQRLMNMAIENLRSFQRGKPANVVN